MGRSLHGRKSAPIENRRVRHPRRTGISPTNSLKVSCQRMRHPPVPDRDLALRSPRSSTPLSGNPTNQDLASVFELASRNLSVIHEASEYAVDTTSGIVYISSYKHSVSAHFGPKRLSSKNRNGVEPTHSPVCRTPPTKSMSCTPNPNQSNPGIQAHLARLSAKDEERATKIPSKIATVLMQGTNACKGVF
jgi:hypothetical protein